MAATKEQIEALQEKIKQDRLDQRRTVLSEIDQAFVDTVAQLAHEADVELEISVQRIVEWSPEEEEIPDETEEEAGEGAAEEPEAVESAETVTEDDYPDLFKGVPKREELIAAGYTSDEEVKALNKTELIDIDGIGDVSAERIAAFYEQQEE